MSITIYHNPRCSKSRRALELLTEKGCNPIVVDYQKQPLSVEALEELLELLDVEAEAVIRKKDAAFKELGLNEQEMENKDWLALLAKTPSLLERPIVRTGDKAVIARPPEKVLELLLSRSRSKPEQAKHA